MTYPRLIATSVLAMSLAIGGNVVLGSSARAMETHSSSMAAQSASHKVSPAVWHQMATVQKKDLMKAQRKLKVDGDYKGAIDGRGGSKTIAAIQEFQKKNGLKQTGWLDAPTWNKLGIHTTMASAAAAK